MSEMDGINRGFVLADESGDLPLSTNLSSCCCTSILTNDSRDLACLETALKIKEKQVRRGEIVKQAETRSILQCSPALLPFSLFDIFMQI